MLRTAYEAGFAGGNSNLIEPISSRLFFQKGTTAFSIPNQIGKIMKPSFFFALFVAIAGLAALVGGCQTTAATQLAANAYGSNSAAGNTFVFNGNRFYYETYGGGFPLLLIHGNGESINSFKGQIEALSRRHKVIAMDSRGHGKSELGTTALTYEQMSEDIN